MNTRYALDGFDESFTQGTERGTGKNRLDHKTFQCLSETNNRDKVFSTCPMFIFMAATEKNRVGKQGRLDEKHTSAFWPVEFVAADRNEGGIKLVDVLERLLAEPLHGV